MRSIVTATVKKPAVISDGRPVFGVHEVLPPYRTQRSLVVMV
jgi:hypothetical protein